jgi:hypothetical protein
MEDEEESCRGGASTAAPDDWLVNTELLAERPLSLIEERFKQFFTLDVGGQGYDMYINMLPNGVCIVGLAPSHPLIHHHRRRMASASCQNFTKPMDADAARMETGSSAADSLQKLQGTQHVQVEKNSKASAYVGVAESLYNSK